MVRKIVALAVTIVSLFTLVACNRMPETPRETAESDFQVSGSGGTPLVGGWHRSESPVITEELKDIFDRATGNLSQTVYKPVALIEEQVVAGMNYSFLCRVTPVSESEYEYYAIVKIYEDLEGNAAITDVLESMTVSEIPPDGEILDGGWASPESPVITEEIRNMVKSASGKMVKTSYIPIAFLAEQVVAGLNYSLLCEIVHDEASPWSEYAVVHIYKNLEGRSQITETFRFSEP